MDNRRIYKAIGGAISGCITGLFLGISVLAVAQATDETSMGSYFDIILYPIVGIITGIIFGLFAPPTFNAVQGGVLGCIIAVGFKGVIAVSNLINNDTLAVFLAVFSVINAAGIGFAIGGSVGLVVWLIDQTQQRISQASNKSDDEFVKPKSQHIASENQTRFCEPLQERKYRVSTSQILLNFVPIVYFVPLTICIIALGIPFLNLFQDEGADLLGVVVFALLGHSCLFSSLNAGGWKNSCKNIYELITGESTQPTNTLSRICLVVYRSLPLHLRSVNNS